MRRKIISGTIYVKTEETAQEMTKSWNERGYEVRRLTAEETIPIYKDRIGLAIKLVGVMAN